MKLWKMDSVIERVNKHIKNDKITPKFINDIEGYYEECMETHTNVQLLLKDAMKFRVKIKIPRKGIYTTKIDID